MEQKQPKRVKALIGQYFGGRYGRSGEYIAWIEPEYFKNGNMIKSRFRVIEVVEVIKKGYGHGSCRHSETIKAVLATEE